MKLSGAFVAMLRSRRFWVWELAGALIYAIPALFKYGTRITDIPILNFPGFWIDHLVPGNLVEKILVNAFFPGGAGGVAGEEFVSNYDGQRVAGRKKNLARLGGALGQTALWSAFQFFGYFLFISGPSGATDSNLFESVFVFPINFGLAALSIFTPDAVGFVNRGVNRLRGKPQ